MTTDFEKQYKIANLDKYNTNRPIYDCTKCDHPVLNPTNCSNCGFFFCKNCLSSSSTCPNKCSNSYMTEPTLSQKNILNQIQLTCTYGCTVSLSQAYSHMTQD